jgi:2-oxoglutarate/2-oxoacid ferredoxin oxidoreductase subunit beta
MAVLDSNLPYVSTWCPGCGNFGIYNSLKKAFGELNLDLEQVALVTGIGCSGKIAQYVNTYRIETLHGRTLPVASGIKMANHTLSVIAEGGDGDGMGLGIGHFIHTARRNLDITYFLHNNQIYGLTKGQASPTSDTGMVTKFTPPPQGNIEHAVNVVQMALSAGATFVARGFAANIAQLVQLMKQAIAHRGFAVVDILQPCVTFNKLNTLQWYQQRVVPVENMEGYDIQNLQQALALSMLWGERIPVGVFYQAERPTYSDSLRQLEQGPLVQQAISDIDIAALMKAFG